MRNLLNTFIFALVVFLFIGFSDLGEIKDLISTELKNEYQMELKRDEAIVSRVVDGDTVHVITSDGKEERVRLLLIDTPESVHPTKTTQPFGKEASEFAKETLSQSKIISLERGNPERDQYDRLLAYLFVDGVNFNKLMLEKGYARVAYVKEPNTKYLEEFKKAEEKAKKQKLNIWSMDGYVTDKGFDMSVVE